MRFRALLENNLRATRAGYEGIADVQTPGTASHPCLQLWRQRAELMTRIKAGYIRHPAITSCVGWTNAILMSVCGCRKVHGIISSSFMCLGHLGGRGGVVARPSRVLSMYCPVSITKQSVTLELQKGQASAHTTHNLLEETQEHWPCHKQCLLADSSNPNLTCPEEDKRHPTEPDQTT